MWVDDVRRRVSGWGSIRRCHTRSSASATEDYAADLITQTFDFDWIDGASETFRKVQEFLLFLP
jgi:hypothetical protein